MCWCSVRRGCVGVTLGEMCWSNVWRGCVGVTLGGVVLV